MASFNSAARLPQSRLRGFRIFQDKLLAEIEFEIDSGQTLHESVVNFAGDPGPLFRHRRAGLFHIQPIQRLISRESFFDFGRRANAGFDQLPHEFRAGPPMIVTPMR